MTEIRKKSANGKVIKTAEELFELHAIKSEKCWDWNGSKNAAGYGYTRVGGRGSRAILAHRLSWALHRGPIPEGMQILHRCDTPSCTNPDHLFVGTNQDNILDRINKGRPGGGTAGEKNPKAKLTEKQILEIRSEYDQGRRNGVELARKYGVGHALIYGIVKRKLWRHV